MRFNFYPPSEHLQSFIQGYLEADSTGITTREEHTLFPNGYPGIFFNFGVMGTLSISTVPEARTAPVSIFGQIDKSFTAIHWPGSYCIGVLFKPAQLARFLRMPVHELTNKAQDGSLMLKELTSLHEQMEACFTASQKITLLDRYFIGHIARMNPTPGVADKALYLMEQNNVASIETIATYLGITTRHLEIQFKRHVGLPPKTYARILRFKRIERLLQTTGPAPWKHIAPTREYYDQNHFIKEFKRFTNHTPSSYLQSTFELNSSYLLP